MYNSHSPPPFPLLKNNSQALRSCGGARPCCPGLPFRLHLLPVRYSFGLRRGDHALQREGRHQRVPGRIRSDGELEIP